MAYECKGWVKMIKFTPGNDIEFEIRSKTQYIHEQSGKKTTYNIVIDESGGPDFKGIEESNQTIKADKDFLGLLQSAQEAET